MRVNIVTNFNGCGLQRDAELLRPILEEMGHTVRCMQFQDQRGAQPADANIFMEVVVPGLFKTAARQFIFVNPEWYARECTQYLQSFEKIFCKTLDAFRLFSVVKGPQEAVMVGFFARDLGDPAIRKTREFVHVAGKSRTKNTQAIIDCWNTYKLPWKLTIISEQYSAGATPSITFHKHVEEVDLRKILNSAWYHIMPSQYEGFGHALHESLGCGGVVLTTGRPPMSEVEGVPKELLIQSTKQAGHHYGTLHYVTGAQVMAAVTKAMELTDEQLGAYSGAARRAFEFERPNFVRRFKEEFVV